MIQFQYKIEVLDNKLHINYFGKLFHNGSENVRIFYGYQEDWKDKGKEKMTRNKDGFYAEIELKNYDIINFCFVNENKVWDNNKGVNYKKSLVEYKKKNKISDSGLLLISEVQNKVFLPYTAEEVEKILHSRKNNYRTEQDVIDNEFTKPLDYYKNPVSARFKETVKLVIKRERMSLKDGIDLALELCRKRFLNPAIISACKNLDELNVYLDCLDKNEVEDFKVFKIRYEMSPMIIRNGNDIYIKADATKKNAKMLKKFLKQTVTIDKNHQLKQIY